MHINSFIESKCSILEESQGKCFLWNIKLVQYQVCFFYEPLKQYDSWKLYKVECKWGERNPLQIQLHLNFKII